MDIGRLRNIGIAAHIDAGKTTLTERFLFYAGKIHHAGNVDYGNTTTDYLVQEQERGITITSAAVSLAWKRSGTEFPINLIDTPGHVDFTIEVERSLRVLDGMVALYSAVEGVQAQSETVWRQANKYRVPRLCFINKMDRLGADFGRTLNAMRERLKDANVVPVQIPMGAEQAFSGVIDLMTMTARTFHGEEQDTQFEEGPIPEEFAEAAAAGRSHMVEKIAELDDALMEKFLSEQPISEAELRAALRRGVIDRRIHPVFTGSALKFKGVQALLDGVCDYLPNPLERPAEIGVEVAAKAKHRSSKGEPDKPKEIACKPDPSEPLAALAFKIIADPNGDLTFLRIYSGTLRSGSRPLNTTRDKKENVTRLVKMFANQRINLEEAAAGDIVAVVGLKETITGDTLCDARRPLLLGRIEFPQTVVSKSVEPETSADKNKLTDALTAMSREDPTFKWSVNPDSGEVIIRGMGELHLTILTERLTRPAPVGRGLPVRVGRPKVAYRETVRGSAEAEHEFNRTIGGKPQFAYVKLRVEPYPQATADEPVAFVDDAPSSSDLPEPFLAAIRQGVEESARTGIVAGYPLINVKVTLTKVRMSETDSTDIAFSQAAYQSLNDACQAAGPVLLEPFMRLEISTPDQYLGSVQGDLQRRRAEINNVEARGDLRVIEAFAPLSELFGYEDDLRSKSQGRASSTMEFARYSESFGTMANM